MEIKNELYDLKYPFPWKQNPHYPEVKKLVDQWIDEYTFLSEAMREDYKRADFASLTALCCPVADLNVSIPMARWFLAIFYFDDFYGPKPTNELWRACDRLVQMLQGAKPSPEDNEVFHQMVKAKDESIACGASPEWMGRFIQGHEYYLSSIAMEREFSYRTPIRFPFLDDCMIIRRAAAAGKVTSDYVELSMKFVLPPEVAEHRFMRKLDNLLGDLVGFCNDIFSYKKEFCDHETVNILLAVQYERGCSLEEALEEAIKMHDSISDKFAELSANPPDFGSNEINELVERYIDNLKLFVHGHYKWYATTARYRDPESEKSVERKAEVLI